MENEIDLTDVLAWADYITMGRDTTWEDSIGEDEAAIAQAILSTYDDLKRGKKS